MDGQVQIVLNFGQTVKHVPQVVTVSQCHFVENRNLLSVFSLQKNMAIFSVSMSLEEGR